MKAEQQNNREFNFSNIHADSLPFKSLELKKQIDYYNNVIKSNFENIDEWKVKEYVACYKDNIKQLNYNIKTMLSNESIFNDLLACYNITVIIFCRKYLNTNMVADLIEKNANTDTEKSCIEFSKTLSTEHEKFKVGDVIEFWAGFYGDIRYKSKIIGFGKSEEKLIKNNEIYVLWDCWWFPIRDDSSRDIEKMNKEIQ